MTDFRVVRFLVHDEPIWRFSDQGALSANPSDFAELRQVGDTSISHSDEGYQIGLAVPPFDDFSIALTAFGHEWCRSAIAALKDYFREASPTATLRLYRDPIDGVLRNLAD